jgi:hypothetical protein
MQYTYILSLIDAHLDRLTKAREILATLDTSQETTPQPVPRPAADSKALRTPGGRSSSALETGSHAISPRKKAAPATMVQKPSASNRASAPLAKVSETAALESAPVADAQNRLDEDQRQETRKTTKSPIRETATSHLVDKLPTKRKRLAPNKPSSTPLARALGGPVPAAPIFIPAGQVSQEFQERSQRHPEPGAEGSLSGSAAPVTLTAELLARRWVQGLAS